MPSYIRQMIGAVIGIVAALLILFLGFWKGVLVILLGLAGWWLAGERKLPQWVIHLMERYKHSDQNL